MTMLWYSLYCAPVLKYPTSFSLSSTEKQVICNYLFHFQFLLMKTTFWSCCHYHYAVIKSQILLISLHSILSFTCQNFCQISCLNIYVCVCVATHSFWQEAYFSISWERFPNSLLSFKTVNSCLKILLAQKGN